MQWRCLNRKSSWQRRRHWPLVRSARSGTSVEMLRLSCTTTLIAGPAGAGAVTRGAGCLSPSHPCLNACCVNSSRRISTMQYELSLHQSRASLTSAHGRLLQGSGFTKRDSTPRSSRDWEHTTTSVRHGSFFQSMTPTGRSSSGRPEIPSIPSLDDPSMSARLSLADKFMFNMDFGATELKMHALLSSPRTYSRHSRLPLADQLVATASWAPSSARTAWQDLLKLHALLSHGSMLTDPAPTPGVQFTGDSLMWDFPYSTFLHPKTARLIAFGKSGA